MLCIERLSWKQGSYVSIVLGGLHASRLAMFKLELCENWNRREKSCIVEHEKLECSYIHPSEAELDSLVRGRWRAWRQEPQ